MHVISLFPKPSAVCCVPAILDENKTGPVSSPKTIVVMFAGINMFWPLLTQAHFSQSDL